MILSIVIMRNFWRIDCEESGNCGGVERSLNHDFIYCHHEKLLED